MIQQRYQQILAWARFSHEEWCDWQWQLRHAVKSVTELNAILGTFTDARVPASSIVQAISDENFSFKVTPHMVVSLRDAIESQIPGAWDAFCCSFAPTEAESPRLEEGADGTDCIGEELVGVSPVHAITNFYGNRVLFRVTSMCPAYCRFCFRRRMVGDGAGAWDEAAIAEGLAYIGRTSTIHEVILSGGDPLVWGDRPLAFLLAELGRMPHIRRVRIDTKALTMLPQRVTQGLLDVLRGDKPLYIVAHFTHISELTSETRSALERLSGAGIPVRSHTPLLRGINDDESSLASLMEALVDLRAQPYYLIQFIPTKWTEHFRVPISRGLELLRHLQKTCGGLAVPTYIVYLPDSAGKVPITPQYLLERRPDGYLFESLHGRQVLYPEPAEAPRATSGRR
jgi:lysine 2,3-aminomutase